MPHHKSHDYKLSTVKYYLKSKNASETGRIFEDCSFINNYLTFNKN